MADETVSGKNTMLGEKGLAKLVSLVLKALKDISTDEFGSNGGYLPLSGGEVKGNLTVTGDLTVQAAPLSAEVGDDSDIPTINPLDEVLGEDIDLFSGGNLTVDGKATFKGQATFNGGTYIGTDGHIHLPSGVEIY